MSPPPAGPFLPSLLQRSCAERLRQFLSCPPTAHVGEMSALSTRSAPRPHVRPHLGPRTTQAHGTIQAPGGHAPIRSSVSRTWNGSILRLGGGLAGARDPVFSARWLAAFGEQRDRFADASAFLKYAGIAPATERSGNKHWVPGAGRAPHSCARLRRVGRELACSSSRGRPSQFPRAEPARKTSHPQFHSRHHPAIRRPRRMPRPLDTRFEA
jgi:hypothetical protein